MPVSEMKWIKRCAELKPKKEIEDIPNYSRGIYALLRYRPKLKNYDVVYIGMSGIGRTSGIKSRIRLCLKTKRNLRIHFSIFEVWDNIQNEEIKELEGLFRHIYRRDTRANRVKIQGSFAKLKRVRIDNFDHWKE